MPTANIVPTANMAPLLVAFLALQCHSITAHAQQAGGSGIPSINPRQAYSAETVQRCAGMNKKLATLAKQIEQSSQQVETDIAAFNQQSEALAKQHSELRARYIELDKLHTKVEQKTRELEKVRLQLEETSRASPGHDASEQPADPRMINYNAEVKAQSQAIADIEDEFAAHQRASKAFNQASARLKSQAELLNQRRRDLNEEVVAYNKAIKLFNEQCQY